MSFSFSAESIENLKNQIDIIDVVGQVVPLKRSGANFKGLCPFHNEKTPSFFVSESRQYYTCFGCGASGDVISFVQKYYNMEFVEAVERLADQYGIEMKKTGYQEDRSEYYEINRLAARFFYNAFTSRANSGYSYMKNRGISPNIMKKFGIGYADGEWDSLYRYLKSKGVDEKKMLELGLVSEGKGKCYDRFRDRVMFPIINTSGKVIGFGGRAIRPDDNPKYLNSPESRVFQKKNNLYALNTAKQDAGREGYIILVEGYMDVISLYQSGIHNTAASLGTALTENQAKLLHRYVKDVVLSYDADKAGRAAALRGIEILRNENCRVRVLHVTDGKDPDEYVKKNGKDAFLKLIDTALPYGDYKLESAKIGYDLSSDQDRIEYMKKAVDIISGMSPIEQEVYKQKVSRELNIAEAALDRELAARRSDVEPQQKRARTHTEEEEEEQILLSPIERTLLVLAASDNQYISRVSGHPELIPSGLSRHVMEYLQPFAGSDEPVDQRKLLEALTEAEAQALRQAFSEVLLGVDHEGVFRDCVERGREEALNRREKEILMRLSMADEEGSHDEMIRNLTNELMKIQKERKAR